MPGKFEIHSVNLTETIKRLEEYGDNAPKICGMALKDVGEQIMRESLRICPVDTGALKSTGVVTNPERHGAKVYVILGYGGVAANGNKVGYAFYVHENPRAGKTGGVSPQGRKYKHWADSGQWKYLEGPIAEHEPLIDAKLAEAIHFVLTGEIV